MCAHLPSRVWLFATPWAPLSMGFSWQEYWSGLPFPPPGDLPAPGIKPASPELQADFFLPLSHWGSTHNFIFEPYFAATSTPVLVHLTRFQFKTKSLFSRPSLPFTHMDKIVTNTKIWKSKWAIKRKLDEKNPSMYITEKVSGVTCTVSSLKVIFTEVQSIMFQRKTKNDETFRLYFIIHPPFKYGTLTVITRINAYCVCLWNENILFL